MPQEYNFGFAFLEKAFAIPDAVALRTPTAEMTYGQLRTRVIRYAQHLRLRGVDRNSCVAIDANRMPEGVALGLALALLGARWVYLTPAVPHQALGVTMVLTLSASRLGSYPNAHVVDASWTAEPDGLDRSKPIGYEGYGSPDAIASYGQSSGTTGRPKFMAKSYFQIWTAIRAQMAEQFATTYSGFPPLSGIGFAVDVRALLKGSTIIVFAADIQQLSAMNVDRVAASPTQIENLIRNVKPPARKIGVLAVAGSAMTPTLIRNWLKYFDRVEMSYGSQETWRGGRLTVTSVPESELVTYSVDADVQVEVVDATDTVLPPNTIGTLRIRTPEMVHDYLGAPEATAEAFRNGWFYPGDLGLRTAEGGLQIHGRVKDLFNFGGIKAHAEDIDEIANRAAGIKAAVSFSRIGAGGLEELCILAALADGTSPEDAAAEIRQNCGSLRGLDLMPKAIYFTEQLPYNENGKAVREMASEIASTAIAY